VRILILFGVLLIVLPPSLAAFREGPLPNMTGGFGEPNCHQCHLDNPIDAPGGRVVIEGAPPAYTPARTYTITVTLTRAGMERGGFEIAARFDEGWNRGKQAGTWQIEGPRLQMIASQIDPALMFVQHTAAGTKTDTPGTISWTMAWTAPPSYSDAVTFHVAANASNDDASPLGDYIYLTHATAVSFQGQARGYTSSSAVASRTAPDAFFIR
jgi:Reeler domain